MRSINNVLPWHVLQCVWCFLSVTAITHQQHNQYIDNAQSQHAVIHDQWESLTAFPHHQPNQEKDSSATVANLNQSGHEVRYRRHRILLTHLGQSEHDTTSSTIDKRDRATIIPEMSYRVIITKRAQVHSKRTLSNDSEIPYRLHDNKQEGKPRRQRRHNNYRYRQRQRYVPRGKRVQRKRAYATIFHSTRIMHKLSSLFRDLEREYIIPSEHYTNIVFPVGIFDNL